MLLKQNYNTVVRSVGAAVETRGKGMKRTADFSDSAYKKMKTCPDKNANFSKLPDNVLVQICSLLSKDDKALENLAITCTRFNKICSSRMTLWLDFNKIFIHKVELPVIKRNYEKIHISGAEVSNDDVVLKKLLHSSRYSARELIIGSIHGVKTKIGQRSMLTILRCLPQLHKLTIDRVNVLQPRFTFEVIKQDECPVLKQLKKVLITSGTANVFHVLAAVRNIEKLYVKDCSNIAILGKLLSKQKGLQTLRLRQYFGTLPRLPHLPELKNIELETMTFSAYENIIADAPKLEKLRFRWNPLDRIRSSSFMLSCKSVTLKSVTVKSYIILNIDQLLSHYPALESFKSRSIKWMKSDY